MNGAQLHLLLNHFPLIGFIFSVLILIMGVFTSKQDYFRAGFLIILVSGALAVPTFLSGEPAEKIIEKYPTFSEQVLEPHEEAAEVAIWFIAVTTLVAGAALWFLSEESKRSKLLVKLVIALNIISLVLVARVSQLGGKISHPEVRGSETIQTSESPTDH